MTESEQPANIDAPDVTVDAGTHHAEAINMITKSVTAAAEFEYVVRLHFLGCADVKVERSEMGVAFWLDGDIIGSGETIGEAYKAARKQALAWRRAAKR